MKFKYYIATISLLLGLSSPVMAGDVAAGEGKSAMCIGCHMADGNSVVDQFPKLAGQHESYLAKQLADFKSSKREDPTMAGFVLALSEEDMADIGAYFATKKSTPTTADETKLALGKDVYRGGNMSTGTPACMGCHGPGGAGNPSAGYPSLAGQHAAYTIKQLKAFRDGVRKNDPNSMMRSAISHMSTAEIEAVANYIAAMK